MKLVKTGLGSLVGLGKNLFKDGFAQSLVGKAADFGMNYGLYRLGNSSLTGAQREANAFTQQQNQNAMAFEERMADKQMNFQADQAATQYQRGVADMQSAGLNPALAYGQGGASAMSGSSGAGVAGASVSPVDNMSGLVQLSLLDANRRKAEAEARSSEARADLDSAQSALTSKQVNAYDALTDAQLRQYESALKNDAVQRKLNKAGIKESEARATLATSQAVLNSIDASTRDRLNQLTARLRVAEIGLATTQSAVNRKRVDEISANIENLLSQAVLNSVTSNKVSQETRNLLVQEGILQYDKQHKQFEVNRQKLTWTLDHFSQLDGMINAPFNFANKFTNVPGSVLRGIIPFAR